MYLLDFAVSGVLNIEQLNLLYHVVSKFLFLLLFRMLWKLFTVNKLKHMACHESQITNNNFKNISYENLF